MKLDVFVIGAGPAGAAISILLARQEYYVLLVDRTTFSRDKACAEYLSPACPPLLAHFGVLDAILTAAPQRLQGMRVMISGPSCIVQRCALYRRSAELLSRTSSGVS